MLKINRFHGGELIAREINRMLENIAFSAADRSSLGYLSIVSDIATHRVGMPPDVKQLKDGVCRSPIPLHYIFFLKANV